MIVTFPLYAPRTQNSVPIFPISTQDPALYRIACDEIGNSTADTLARIAKKLGVQPDAIAALNPDIGKRILQPCDIIKVPQPKAVAQPFQRLSSGKRISSAISTDNLPNYVYPQDTIPTPKRKHETYFTFECYKAEFEASQDAILGAKAGACGCSL